MKITALAAVAVAVAALTACGDVTPGDLPSASSPASASAKTPAKAKASDVVTCQLKAVSGFWTASGTYSNDGRDVLDVAVEFKVNKKGGGETLTGYGSVSKVKPGTKARWSGAVTDDTKASKIPAGSTCEVVDVTATPTE